MKRKSLNSKVVKLEDLVSSIKELKNIYGEDTEIEIIEMPKIFGKDLYSVEVYK